MQYGRIGPSSFLLFSLSFSLCLANSARCVLAGCREMEEDQSAIVVAEGTIKSIKLSLSTEEEIVSSLVFIRLKLRWSGLSMVVSF